MKNRRLGSTGREVSEVGISTRSLADTWRRLDERELERLLRAHLDTGLSAIDVTPLPEVLAHAQVVGEAVRGAGARDRAVVSTTVLPQSPPAEAAPLEALFAVERVQRTVEDTLRAMRAEALVVSQLGVWQDQWLESAYWPVLLGTLERLVKEGKVLHWGIATAPGAAAPVRSLELPIFETARLEYNIFAQSDVRPFFALCAEHEVAVLAENPFDYGALSSQWTPETEFPPRSFHAGYFRAPRLVELQKHLAPLRELVFDGATTIAALALKFCLAPPEVGTVLVDIGEAIPAVGDTPLPSDILERLGELSWDRNWSQ